MTTLLYRLFGIGKIPALILAEVQQEGVLLFDEGLHGSVTYRNFRAPGRISSMRRQWFPAAIALTNTRLLALSSANPVINVPRTDKRMTELHYSVEDGSVLCIRFDAALFHSDWSGTIEYRFTTPQAQHFLELLQQYHD
jgi:hypothetical protein